jgi:hypothetical protein
VPADAGVEDCDALLLQERGEFERLVPGLAVLDEIEQRDPIDDREAVADQFACPRTTSTGKRIRFVAEPPTGPRGDWCARRGTG